MRATIVLVLISLTACGGSGGSGDPGAASLETIMARVVEGSNSTTRILPLDDGSTIVAGRALNADASFVDPAGIDASVDLAGETFFLCYDADGELLWHHTHDDQLRWLDLEAAPDGSILAFGTTDAAVQIGSVRVSPVNGYAHTYFLARFNRAGDILSVHTLIGTDAPFRGSPRGQLAVAPDDSFAVVVNIGARFRFEPGTIGTTSAHNVAIVRYGTAWTPQDWRFGTVTSIGAFEMLSDGNLLVSATNDEAGDALSRRSGSDSELVEFDVQLIVRRVVSFGGEFDVWSAIECADGYALAGRYQGELTVGDDTLPDGEGSILMRLTGAGELAWTRDLGATATFSSLACGPGDTILAAGGYKGLFEDEEAEGSQDGLLALYDDDGNRQWLRRFPSPDWLNVSQAWFLSGGDIALSGQASGPANIGVPGGLLPVDAEDILFMLRLSDD